MSGEEIAVLALAYLDEHFVGTAEEIARAVRRRSADVRAALNADGRFIGPFDVGPVRHKRAVFLAPHSARDDLGRAS